MIFLFPECFWVIFDTVFLEYWAIRYITLIPRCYFFFSFLKMLFFLGVCLCFNVLFHEIVCLRPFGFWALDHSCVSLVGLVCFGFLYFYLIAFWCIWLLHSTVCMDSWANTDTLIPRWPDVIFFILSGFDS